MTNKTKCAILALLLMGSLFSLVGCQKEASEEETKKANASQQPTAGEASLGNPKPADSGGK